MALKFFKKLVNFWPVLLVLLSIFTIRLIEISSYPPITDNHDILGHRIAKLETTQDLDVVFIGDSSCGNGIDEILASRFTELNTTNLCLTGSFGLTGTRNMLARAKEKVPKLRQVFIVQTWDIWQRPFDLEGCFLTVGHNINLLPLKNFSWIDYFTQFFNWKRAAKLVKSQVQPFLGLSSNDTKIEASGDFLRQGEDRYSNARKQVLSSQPFLPSINEEKIVELVELDDYCCDNKLECTFVHGPAMKQFIASSDAYRNEISKMFYKHTKCIRYIPEVIAFEPHEMGDSWDHVDPKFKATSTVAYAKMIKSLRK